MKNMNIKSLLPGYRTWLNVFWNKDKVKNIKKTTLLLLKAADMADMVDSRSSIGKPNVYV